MRKNGLKKYILIALFALVVMIYLQVSKKSNPEQTAEKFLSNYYSLNFKKIYDLSTENTLKKIKDIEINLPEDFDRSSIQKPIIVLHEYYIENDTAYCRYTIKQDVDDTNALSEYLRLIKSKNKWLVDY